MELSGFRRQGIVDTGVAPVNELNEPKDTPPVGSTPEAANTLPPIEQSKPSSMGDNTGNGVDNYGYKATDGNGVSHLPDVDRPSPPPYSDVEKNKEEEDGKDKKEEPMPMVGLGDLFRYSTGLDKLLMLLGTLCAMGHGACLPGLLIVFGDMIDAFINFENLNSTNVTTLAIDPASIDIIGLIRDSSINYIYIAVVVLVVAYGQVAFWLMASFRQTNVIRSSLFSAIMRQEIGWFDTHEPGELNTRMTEDVNKVQEGIGDKLGNFWQWLATFLAGMIIGFVYGWKMSLVILACSPLLVISGGLMTKLLMDFTSKELEAYAKAGAVAEEVLSSIKTVSAFSGQEREIVRYEENLGVAKAYGMRKGMIAGGMMGLVFFIIFAIDGLAFWYGSKLVRDEPENYTAGTMLIVFFCVLIGAFALGNAFPNLQNLAAARGAAYTIYGILDNIPKIDTKSEEGTTPEFTGHIEFRGVNFRYPARDEVQVMTDFNLKVEPGQTVALVGSSGCGKSTTVQLLQRFYDPEGGQILIDGIDIREMNVRWLRTHLGIVSQEPILFGTTIKENIRYGREGVTDDEIVNASRNANAYDFIMKLPQQFETLVGERGAQMSGGQKQRIAIARALVRNPKILLLDEATSALDMESEAVVQEAMDKAREGRTTLVIAHRLSTVKNADLIVGIDKGHIMEQGSHAELMQQGGIYCTLATNQSGGEGMDEIDVEVSDANLALKSGARASQRKLKRGISNVSASGAATKDKEEEEDLPEPQMMRMMAMNKPEWCQIFWGCIGSILNGVVQPLFAIVFAELLGVFTLPLAEQPGRTALYSGFLVIIGIAQGIAMFLQSYMFAWSGEALTERIRSLAFRSLLKQEMSYFDNPKNNTGALTARLSTDAAAVQGATGARIGTVLQSFSAIIVGVIIGFIYSWQLTLLVLAFVPFIGIAGLLQMKIISGYSQDGQAALEGAGKVATEAVENIRTVATLGKEDTFYQLYVDLLAGPHKNSIRKASLNGLAFSFSQSLLFFAYAACFYLGAHLVEEGKLGFTNMMKVFSAIVFGAMAAGQASHFAPDYAKAKLAVSRLFLLFDQVPTIDSSSEEGEKPSDVTGEVEFQEVEFSYPTRDTVKVLNRLNISVKPGQTVALVGSSGCGKSTSVQLLERFYDISGGQILMDGRPLTDLNIGWLRQQMGIVQQEPILFDTSILENIRYGDNTREAPMDEVIQAARDANIHSFIEQLPEGYETNVGDKGTQLSGGQKQRIAIARALLRNPKILLLDEATSALDTESEKVVQEALDRAQEGRTCIVIAHRLSTIQDADTIVVIHNGAVMEQGTHSDLIEQKGFYFRLLQAQLKKR